MNRVMDAVFKFLSQPMVDEYDYCHREQEQQNDAPMTVNPLPFEVNERAYYLNRIESRLKEEYRAEQRRKENQSARRGDFFDYAIRDPDFRSDIKDLELSTLVMIDQRMDRAVVDRHDLAAMDEPMLRSVLQSISLVETEHGMLRFKNATSVMREYHGVPDDLTVLEPHYAKAVASASFFLAHTGFLEACPPRLTDFIMNRPECAADAVRYVEVHQIDRNNVHSIDLDALREFLDTPARSLREGTL